MSPAVERYLALMLRLAATEEVEEQLELELKVDQMWLQLTEAEQLEVVRGEAEA